MDINDNLTSKKNFAAKLEIILEAIKQCNNIVITTHMNPDGDAIGSALGLYFYLKETGKNPSLICIDPAPPNIVFLEGTENIEIYKPQVHDVKINNADMLIIVDLNDAGRLRELSGTVFASKARKIIIDHHMNPKDFADLYLIDTEASSVGEMIWRLLKLDNDYSFSPQTASALYVAIMTDSGSFRFPRTDAELHLIVADLIDSGADPVYLYDEVYNQLPYRSFKLKNEGYSSMQLYFDGRLCLMPLAYSAFTKWEAIEDDTEGFVEELLSIKGVRVGILLTEVPARDEIRVSFRSKGDYSVRELAEKFGGGGHEYAAGARVKGSSLDDVQKELLRQFEEMYREKLTGPGI